MSDPIRTLAEAQAERRARMLAAVQARMPVGSIVQHIEGSGTQAQVLEIVAKDTASGCDIWLRLRMASGEVWSLAGWFAKVALT